MTRAALHLAEALADMKGRQGVELKDLLPEEIAALVHACDRMANPFAEVNAEACGYPVRVAEGVYFWKLTVGASVWLDEIEKLLPEGVSNKIYRLALIYAVGNARNKEAFTETSDLVKIRKTVKRYFKSLAATTEEINLALDILFKLKPDTRKSDVQAAAADWCAVCARLETQTGIPADEWLWKRSGAYLIKCYNDLRQFAQAYCVNGGDKAHLQDELDDAVNALQLLKVNIMKRVKHG